MLSDEEILALYNDPKFDGSFSGVKTFRDFLYSEKNELIPEKRLFAILKKDKNYLLHMKPTRKFPTRPYDVQSFGNCVQIDLAEMPHFEGYKYFLVAIDVFSKHLYTRALKSKSSKEVGEAFESIYNEFKTPIYKLESDQGQEFVANKTLFKKLGIYFHTKVGRNKASFVESAIAMIKRKLYMMLRSQLSQNWPHYLEITVNSLNKRHVKALGNVAPIEINSFVDDIKIREAQEKNKIEPYREPVFEEQRKLQENYKPSPKFPFDVGKYVYLDLPRNAFDKGYDMQISINVHFKNFGYLNKNIGT
jgi:Integrase core domain